MHGVVFDGNTFILNEQVNGAIYVEANAGKFIVINNKFYSYEKTYTKAVWVENPTDSKLYPDGKTTAYYNGNDYNNVGKPDSENVNFILSSRDIYGIFPPAIDDKYSLGMSSRRWKSLYAKSGIIQTSDERQKQQTSVIPDSWLDAWRDVEYTRFKFNSSVNKKSDKARWHVGVIAQQIYDVFNKHGLNAFDIGLLCYDEWIDEETGEKKDIWSVRTDECLFMESALMRRELNKIKQ